MNDGSPLRDGAAAQRAESTAQNASSRRRRRREFYGIGEVCNMLDLKPHVLRYWETQFEALSPSKNRSGNRVYREADIETIALIQRLVHDERYSIEGARRRLEELQAAGTTGDRPANTLERSFLRALRGELERILDILDSSPR
jgi:DNA-binding transcriptional MerR regulator